MSGLYHLRNSFTNGLIINTTAFIQYVLFFAGMMLLSSSDRNFAAAQYVGFGLCPRVFGMPDFNITRYEGKWYEVEKYWFLFEATSACVSVEYLDKGDGTFAVEINQYDMFSARKMKNPGTTKYLSRDGSAEFVLDLLVTQLRFPFRFQYPYIVIDTDYTSYTIKYHCQQVGPINLQTMWILSRNITFTPEARKMAYAKLRRLGLDSTRLTISDQESCPH